MEVFSGASGGGLRWRCSSEISSGENALFVIVRDDGPNGTARRAIDAVFSEAWFSACRDDLLALSLPLCETLVRNEGAPDIDGREAEWVLDREGLENRRYAFTRLVDQVFDRIGEGHLPGTDRQRYTGFFSWPTLPLIGYRR